MKYVVMMILRALVKCHNPTRKTINFNCFAIDGVDSCNWYDNSWSLFGTYDTAICYYPDSNFGNMKPKVMSYTSRKISTIIVGIIAVVGLVFAIVREVRSRNNGYEQIGGNE